MTKPLPEAIKTVQQGFRCCCCDLPVLRRDGPCATRIPGRYSKEATEIVRSMIPVWDAAVKLREFRLGANRNLWTTSDSLRTELSKLLTALDSAIKAASEEKPSDAK